MAIIRIEDLEAQDFSDIATGNALRPIHPGEILREEFLVPLALSANALALALKVPAPRIGDIVREKRAVTPDTALRLARYFGTRPEFWLNLQAAHDLRMARQKASASIEREVSPRETA
jgi:addiction module HigA family antidote